MENITSIQSANTMIVQFLRNQTCRSKYVQVHIPEYNKSSIDVTMVTKKDKR